ncbi:glycoside hydrolase family 97 catalytic domain-containing protein [Bacteroides ovatus]|nr:glycoside hydrolase family 97 catalytic domain-containing protein [Bacteroides ovatus]
MNRLMDFKEAHDGQYGVRHYRKVIETAAKYQIAIDNHEPVMPTGIERTWPNLMTQEGVRGQGTQCMVSRWRKSAGTYNCYSFYQRISRPHGLHIRNFQLY